jgi:hypothetical protein
MAKKRHRKSGLNQAAASVGKGLGDLIAAYAKWARQRDVIAGELKNYLTAAQKMLLDMGHSVEVSALQAVKRGRRAGYKQSAEARAKMRAAWAKRKARVTRVVSPEARARLSRLAKARWAQARKAGKTRLG